MPRHFGCKVHTLACFALLVFIVSLPAIVAIPARAQNPVPLTSQPLVPDAAAPGGPAFTMTVNGTEFVAASVVNWNGNPRVTTFVSSTQLSAQILASDIASPSTAAVTVVSPGPGGGTSIPVFFAIAEPEGSVPFVKTDSASPGFNVEIATADFNGDGILDLVAGEFYDSKAAILLGNGDGTFREAGTYSACQAHGVAVGDFNGDGIMDIAVSNAGCGEVTILLGKGDGTFTEAGSFPTGSGSDSPYSVAVGDFNGDGKLDLVTADDQNNKVSILLGNGDGTFQPHASYPTGTDSWKVVTGDFNRDGLLDVAVAGADGVSVLLGKGDGTLRAAVLYPFNPGGISHYMLTADLNGDGKLDFVVANTKGIVGVMMGNGDGTFKAPVTYSTGGNPGCCTAVAAADFRGVGILDLAVTNYGGGTISLLPGNGDGTFGTFVSYPGDAGARGVAVGDFNRDGRLDLAVGNQETHSVSALLQMGGSPTTTKLVSSLNPSNYGQSVTFTATVSSASGTPTGTVIFYDGSTALGSSTLASGSASLSTSSLSSGSHPMTATYQGSSSFAPSTSAVVNQVVNGAVSTTALASSLNPSNFGQSVAFTATVSSASGTPTGTVVFYDGSSALGSVTLANGSASFSTSALAAGSHSITAAYQGSGSFGPSTSAPLKQVVDTVTTTTALTSSDNPARVKERITYTATVTSQFGGAVTGTVVFEDGGVTIATVALSGNQAAFTTSYAVAGIHVITASYSGDGNNGASMSSVLSEQIGKVLFSSKTVLATSGSPSVVGQPVTFTATITSPGGKIPDGELVTFYDEDKTIGTSSTTGGAASFTTSSLTGKTHFIRGAYAGDAQFKRSAGIVTQVVNKYTTTTSLVSSLNPAVYGQPITYTATVVSTGPAPEGNVKITDIGLVPLINGVATFTKPLARAGTHDITAEYLGDSLCGKSTSPVLVEVVNQASTTTAITSSANPSSSGQTVTFTATVTSSTGVDPFGTVTFTAGEVTLGTVAVKNTVASIATATLPVGSTTITATYSGAAGFTGSSASLTQVVQP
jgi:Bacterial Ig-like domain (group 3)/FG-GAP-like repeat